MVTVNDELLTCRWFVLGVGVDCLRRLLAVLVHGRHLQRCLGRRTRRHCYNPWQAHWLPPCPLRDSYRCRGNRPSRSACFAQSRISAKFGLDCDITVGWLKMTDMKLTDMKLSDQVSRHEIDGHENDGHEIGGQDIYRLKIDYITMQCAILFKQRQNTSHSSAVSCIDLLYL